MDKRLIVSPNQEKERDVFFVQEDREFLKKAAAKAQYHPEVEDYIKKAKPLPGLIQVLITALGAYPFWPQNANGDIFKEEALKHRGLDYGVDTFVSNANYFTHHVNKDPALAKGKVLKSVWNDKMKRVELIIGIDPVKDPDASREIDAGRELAFSMGARLPYDVCSVCANKAKTRAQYCDHLKYFMSQMDPDTGILVGAVNPHPKFFDISRVLIPADKTAYMWEKIASAGNQSVVDMHKKLGSAVLNEIPGDKLFDIDFLQEKVASLMQGLDKTYGINKKAAITKMISTSTELIMPDAKKVKAAKKALDANSPDLPIDKLARHPFNEVISSMLVLGIVPKSSEIDKLASVYEQSSMFDDGRLYGENFINKEVVDALTPYVESRSFSRDILTKRLSSLPAGFSKIAAEEKKEDGISKARAATLAGLAAGIYALLSSSDPSSKRSAMADMAKSLSLTEARRGTPVSNSVIMGLLTLGALALLRKKDEPVQIGGNFVVASQPKSLYNNDWQRRLIELQNRPVAVIKTAEDQNDLKPVEEAFLGLPAIFMCADLEEYIPEKAYWYGSPATVDYQGTTKLAEESLGGVNRITKKQHSISSPEFLSMLHSNDKIGIQDLAIQGLISEKF